MPESYTRVTPWCSDNARRVTLVSRHGAVTMPEELHSRHAMVQRQCPKVTLASRHGAATMPESYTR
eukprot:434436-Prorocentrum_minimum.AAC.1